MPSGEAFWPALDRALRSDHKLERANAYDISDHHDELLDQLRSRLKDEYGKRRTSKGRLSEFAIEILHQYVFGPGPDAAEPDRGPAG